MSAVDPDRLGRDAARIAQEVAHLNALVGTDAEITIEVRATDGEEVDEVAVRTVKRERRRAPVPQPRLRGALIADAAYAADRITTQRPTT